MDFINVLNQVDIKPETYLKKAKNKAQKLGLNYKTLNFSKAKHKKLCIRDDYNKLVNFGSSVNGDYIIWSIFEKRRQVPQGFANKKQYVFWRSHTAMKYDKQNPYSANNLSLNILW